MQIEALREMVDRRSWENPHLTGRLEKAGLIVLLRSIEDLDSGTDHVVSEDVLESCVTAQDSTSDPIPSGSRPLASLGATATFLSLAQHLDFSRLTFGLNRRTGQPHKALAGDKHAQRRFCWPTSDHVLGLPLLASGRLAEEKMTPRSDGGTGHS